MIWAAASSNSKSLHKDSTWDLTHIPGTHAFENKLWSLSALVNQPYLNSILMFISKSDYLFLENIHPRWMRIAEHCIRHGFCSLLSIKVTLSTIEFVDNWNLRFSWLSYMNFYFPNLGLELCFSETKLESYLSVRY